MSSEINDVLGDLGHRGRWPTPWQLICRWRGWPWAPKAVSLEQRNLNAPWVSLVWQDGQLVSWHRHALLPHTVVVEPLSRWACLWGLLVGGPEIAVEIIPGTEAPVAVLDGGGG